MKRENELNHISAKQNITQMIMYAYMNSQWKKKKVLIY